ncbi:hypothetical protein [Ferrovum sp. PN-J185]|uniref:hypothetical protein n=2 Tax=Ferrovum sp. PN-J185 TaxID=1356306 RepID=UPI0018D4B77C|nr:hypothetical protein [Ferrovum sp. PN-J185]
MKKHPYLLQIIALISIVVLLILKSENSYACACGCGMFDQGLPSGLGLPSVGSGGVINIQETFLDQNKPMSGSATLPQSQSPDKEIKTQFTNINMQYNFNHNWGMMAMIPYWHRTFSTDNNFGQNTQSIANYQTKGLGDIRVMGMYTGFSDDMSEGLIFGVKLPTGNFNAYGFDRDTQIGSGTTDTLVGGYKVGQYRYWGWYTQGMYRRAMDVRNGYRPGDSIQMLAGIHYDDIRKIPGLTPLLQINGTIRYADSGINSNPYYTGLRTLYLAPGLIYNINHKWQLNGLIYLPLYQQVSGIQLVPKQIVSLGVSYLF